MAYDKHLRDNGLHDDDAWYLIAGVFAAVFVAVLLVFGLPHTAQTTAISAVSEGPAHVRVE